MEIIVFRKWWFWLVIILILIFLIVIFYPKSLPESMCPCWDGIRNECLPQSACV
ncbi:hypothetical protein J4448_04875 [Candidatus Woesearchaeota archaeon]|nr:hypothetical protein [Candidatus Woesearchaeota archaeon]